MTMITTAAAPRLAGGDDGQTLQRRQLLDMERQWLNSWTQADQLAADAKSNAADARKGPAPARDQEASSAALQGLGGLSSPARPLAGTPSPARPQEVGAARSPAPLRESGATPPAQAALGPEDWAATAGRQGASVQEQDGRMALAPDAADAAAAEGRSFHGLAPDAAGAAAAEGRSFQGLAPASPRVDAASMAKEALRVAGAGPREPAMSAEQTGLTARTWSSTRAVEGSTPASITSPLQAKAPQPPTAAAAGQTAQGAPQDVDAGASDGPEYAAGTARKAQAAASTRPGSDSSPQDRQRITLRELDAATVQATLRDAQLDAQSSQLAARGLHHALMEAGYARVRVVVNGHAAKSGPGSRTVAAPDSAHDGIAPASLRRKT